MIVYEPRRVVVMGLTLDIGPEVLYDYFGLFGTVTDVIVKVKPTSVYAFVEFESEDVMRAVVAHDRHLIEHVTVRVLRAYKNRLPSRPFPGMDAHANPLRQAMRQHLCQRQRRQLEQQRQHEHVWDQDLYRAIQSIWA